jgi:microcompartment protein CcmK/EutM
MAFLTKKPAVISMHRLNFMGSLVAQNRTDNLQLFKQLMVKLIEKWPEVEFMTTDELGDLIKTQKNA